MLADAPFIGLPASILDDTGIPPVILILNKNKPAGSPVIFVDGSEIGSVKRFNIEISEQNANLIATLASGKLLNDELNMVDEFKKLENCQKIYNKSQQN